MLLSGADGVPPRPGLDVLSSPVTAGQPPHRVGGPTIGRSPMKGGRGTSSGPYLNSPGRGGRGRGRMDGGGRGKRPVSLVSQPGPRSQYQTSPGKVQQAARFMPEGLRQTLQHRSYLAQSKWSGPHEECPLPDHLQHFHTLYPLEDFTLASERPSTALGVRTYLFKATNAHDGLPYAIRRIDGKQVLPTAELVSAAREVVKSWAHIAPTPTFVALRGAFVSNEVEHQPSLFFIHDYHPGALTLEQAHLQPTTTSSGLVHSPVTEEQLWSYLVQLTSAIRAAHSSGLALRPGSLAPSKVIITEMGRIRVAATGILEALTGDLAVQEDITNLQRNDLLALGHLLLSLACSGLSPSQHSLDYCSQHYSPDLVRVIATLLGSTEGSANLNYRHLCSALGERIILEMDSITNINDALLYELQKEMENGRLLRLLIKLGFINERPEGNGVDSKWSEQGDRYLLKLFRDFVFHQVAEDGTPRLDWGHVIEALNKLDTGVDEKIVLLSRDESSMLVVSYQDIRTCVEGALSELKSMGGPVTSRPER